MCDLLYISQNEKAARQDWADGIYDAQHNYPVQEGRSKYYYVAYSLTKIKGYKMTLLMDGVISWSKDNE